MKKAFILISILQIFVTSIKSQQQPNPYDSLLKIILPSPEAASMRYSSETEINLFNLKQSPQLAYCVVGVNTSVSAVTISGNGEVDELRLYPRKAHMTTYCYQPKVGLISVCDANNKILYYEYDSVGRLILIRDQDRNVVKTFEYKFEQSVN